MVFSVKLLILAAVLTCGVALAQSDTTAELLNQLPENVDKKGVEELKNKSQAALKEKCEKNGGPEAFIKAQKSMEALPGCVKTSLGLEDPELLKKEIEAAKPTGTVDEVFKKYCAKTPEALNCFKEVKESSKDCFSAEEQKNLKTVYNVTEQLAQFICYKEGDRIALFIAEGGPECFDARRDEIQSCVNQTMGGSFQLNTNNLTANSIPNIPDIAFGEEECQKMTDLEQCVVKALNLCKAPTSANIVESLFKFVRKATPCVHMEKKETTPGSQVSAKKVKSAAYGLVSLRSAVLGFALLAAIF